MTTTIADLLLALDDDAIGRREADDVHASERERATSNAVDTERALLSCIVVAGGDVLDEIEGVGLRASDFFGEGHGEVFDAATSLHASRQVVEALTIVDELSRRGVLDDVGGIDFVSSLQSVIPSTAHASSYATMLRDQSRGRQLARLGRIVTRRAERGERWVDIADAAETELLRLQNERSTSTTANLSRVVTDALASIPALGGSVVGTSTGFADVDPLFLMKPGDLIILAGRPSMGKTAFALDIARDLAVTRDEPVAFFSLEMPAEQLVQRIIGAHSRVPLRKPSFTNDEAARVTQAAADIRCAPLFIDDSVGLSVGDIRARARAMHRRRRLSAVFVDYLSLVRASTSRDSKAQEVAEVSGAFKQLARELSVPVVCLSQLNRGVEARQDKRPVMSDLRDSGAIEQDADVIGMLYREEYYYADKSKVPNDAKGVAECIVGKNRNGPTGVVRLHFNERLPRFDSLQRGYP